MALKSAPDDCYLTLERFDAILARSSFLPETTATLMTCCVVVYLCFPTGIRDSDFVSTTNPIQWTSKLQQDDGEITHIFCISCGTVCITLVPLFERIAHDFGDLGITLLATI